MHDCPLKITISSDVGSLTLEMQTSEGCLEGISKQFLIVRLNHLANSISKSLW